MAKNKFKKSMVNKNWVGSNYQLYKCILAVRKPVA